MPLTALFGREQEAALAVSLLRRDDVRLLTLTGPGGVGKTRLAIKIADEVAELFRDGVRFVSLAAVPHDDQVATTIAHAFGLVGAGDIPVLDTLTAYLRDADLLLILDNLEHVLDAAPLLTDLLGACPRPQDPGNEPDPAAARRRARPPGAAAGNARTKLGRPSTMRSPIRPRSRSLSTGRGPFRRGST